MATENKTLRDFMDELAGAQATPGGGSAAALLGAMGAGLVSMVCNLTLGKKAYADVQAQVQALLAESEALRTRMLAMIDEDIQAFDEVMAAYRMPTGTDEERAAREPVLQTALQRATSSPLECAAAAARVLELAETAAAIGSRHVISDAGVGASAAHAALRSAALNVQINLRGLKDRAFASASERKLETLLDGCGARLERTLETVRGKL